MFIWCAAMAAVSALMFLVVVLWRLFGASAGLLEVREQPAASSADATSRIPFPKRAEYSAILLVQSREVIEMWKSLPAFPDHCWGEGGSEAEETPEEPVSTEAIGHQVRQSQRAGRRVPPRPSKFKNEAVK